MIADDTNVSIYMNSNYKSKTYLDHEIRYNKGATKGFCWVSPLRTCEMVTAITISLFFIVVGGLNGLDSMSPVRRLREKNESCSFRTEGIAFSCIAARFAVKCGYTFTRRPNDEGNHQRA